MLLLYTPLPWLLTMYVVAFRHDLTRIASPFRDHATQRDWWSVCTYLGLISRPVPRPNEDLLRKAPSIAIVVSAAISLLWLPLPIRPAWYYLCAVQALAALPLFLLLVAWVGPLPYATRRDVLPYPRLGTRVRHLVKAKEARR